jgi:hypothetical protein
VTFNTSGAFFTGFSPTVTFTTQSPSTRGVKVKSQKSLPCLDLVTFTGSLFPPASVASVPI